LNFPNRSSCWSYAVGCWSYAVGCWSDAPNCWSGGPGCWFGGLQLLFWKLRLLHPCFTVAFLISGFRFTLPSTCVVFAFDMCCHELLEICSVCGPISRPEKRQLKWEDWLKPPCWAAGLLFALVLGFHFVPELVACLVFSVSCQTCSGRLCSYKTT
jgi:hypothetical protein